MDELERIEAAVAVAKGKFGCNLPLAYQKQTLAFLRSVINDVGRPYLFDATYRYGRARKMQGWRGQISDYSLVCGGGIHLIDIMLLGGALSQPQAHVVYEKGRCVAHMSMFTLGNAVAGRLLCDFGYEGDHEVSMSVSGTKGRRELVFRNDEIDKARAIRLFIHAIETDGETDGLRAIKANRACLELQACTR